MVLFVLSVLFVLFDIIRAAMDHDTAFVFPGQGSQAAGMGKDVAEKYPAARRVFEEIDDALGFPISKLCFEGPEEQLELTENTQPAILAVSSALHAVLEEHGAARRDLVAGHSLGEYSAIVSVGGLTPAEAAKIVRARGKFMQEAVPGGTATLIGPSVADRLAPLLDAANFKDLWVALVSNVDASPIGTPTAVRNALLRQVASPVRWVESVEKMVSMGVKRFVEVGPGSVLAGLIKRIDPSVEILNVSDVPSLESFLEKNA